MTLGKAGRGWWRWAWTTPQAAAWPKGSEVIVARRALLEDVVAGGEPSASLLVEIRQLDDRLGLSPKAMAQMRWTIGEPAVDAESEDNVVVPDRWRNAATG